MLYIIEDAKRPNMYAAVCFFEHDARVLAQNIANQEHRPVPVIGKIAGEPCAEILFTIRPEGAKNG